MARGFWIAGKSCASSARCVATDSAGQMHVSPNPAAGETAWSLATADSGAVIWGVSCASDSFCAAGDSNGNVLVGRVPGSI
jgi:hypothetical protein